MFNSSTIITKTLWLVALINTQGISIFARQEYPVLTRVISFEDLAERKTVKMVEWTDPDGTREKMRITEMSIPVSRKMKELTKDFVLANYGLNSIWIHPPGYYFSCHGRWRPQNQFGSFFLFE